MTTYRTVDHAACPHCGKTADAASHFQGEDSAPAAGDAAICAYCGAFNIYTEDLTLRRPTRDEYLQAQEMERVRFAIERIQEKARLEGREPCTWTPPDLFAR